MGEVRDAAGRFRKGRTGNAGGRPKGLAATVREVTDLDQLLSMLVGIVSDTNSRAADRIRACELLLDRGWGKAATFQPIVDADPLGRSELDLAILDIVKQIRHAPIRAADQN